MQMNVPFSNNLHIPERSHSEHVSIEFEFGLVDRSRFNLSPDPRHCFPGEFIGANNRHHKPPWIFRLMPIAGISNVGLQLRLVAKTARLEYTLW